MKLTTPSAPTAQTALSAIALLLLGFLAGGMLFISIPVANATAMTFILGALAGTLTTGAVNKTTSTGPDANIQVGAQPQEQPHPQT